MFGASCHGLAFTNRGTCVYETATGSADLA